MISRRFEHAGGHGVTITMSEQEADHVESILKSIDKAHAAKVAGTTVYATVLFYRDVVKALGERRKFSATITFEDHTTLGAVTYFLVAAETVRDTFRDDVDLAVPAMKVMVVLCETILATFNGEVPKEIDRYLKEVKLLIQSRLKLAH